MLRVLMIVSGAFEALFGLSALIAPDALIASLGTEPNAASIFLARILGVLAAGFILWTAVGLGGAALWSAGLIHAAIGALFVYALARVRR